MRRQGLSLGPEESLQAWRLRNPRGAAPGRGPRQEVPLPCCAPPGVPTRQPPAPGRGPRRGAAGRAGPFLFVRPRRLRLSRPAPAAQLGDRRDYCSRDPSARPHPRPLQPNAAPSRVSLRPARAATLPAPSADGVPRDTPTPASAAPPPPGRRARRSVGGAPGLCAGVGPAGLRSGPPPTPPDVEAELSAELSGPW